MCERCLHLLVEFACAQAFASVRRPRRRDQWHKRLSRNMLYYRGYAANPPVVIRALSVQVVTLATPLPCWLVLRCAITISPAAAWIAVLPVLAQILYGALLVCCHAQVLYANPMGRGLVCIVTPCTRTRHPSQIACMASCIRRTCAKHSCQRFPKVRLGPGRITRQGGFPMGWRWNVPLACGRECRRTAQCPCTGQSESTRSVLSHPYSSPPRHARARYCTAR